MTKYSATVAFVVFACTCTEVAMAVEMDQIQGSWVLVSIDGRELEKQDGSPRFSIRGSDIEGHDGCNLFSGSVDNPSSIVVGQRGCSGDRPRLPIDLTDPKAHLAQASLEGDQLVLPRWKSFSAAAFVRAD